MDANPFVLVGMAPSGEIYVVRDDDDSTWLMSVYTDGQVIDRTGTIGPSVIWGGRPLYSDNLPTTPQRAGEGRAGIPHPPRPIEGLHP